MASDRFEISSPTRTMLGEYLQLVKWGNLQYTMEPNTTLNELFDVLPGVSPEPGVVPSIKYLTLGNLGHRFVIEDDQSAAPDPVRHNPRDAACFNHIPFALREVTNDFPPDVQKLYCLRVNETHNNKQYVAYYGYRLDLSTSRARIQRVITRDGQETQPDYKYTSENLHPTRPTADFNGATAANGIQYAATAMMRLSLDARVIEEIVNAYQIRTGSPRSPFISELALCSGIDKTVPIPGASSGSYLEAIACQVNVFLSTAVSLGHFREGIDLTLDLGASEPHGAGDATD